MDKDIEFVDGLIVKAPHERAPRLREGFHLNQGRGSW
jgi:hypothetical protein